MKKLFILAFAAVAVSALAVDPVQFYEGDFNGTNGLSSEINTAVADARVYQSFDVTGGGYTATGVFANFLISSLQSSQAHWEIRSGVSEGNGGTLLGSGNITVTQTATGRSGFGLLEYDFAGDISPLVLTAGHYYVDMAVIGQGSGRAFMSTTSGANSINGGTPVGDSFFDSTTFGSNFTSTANLLGAPSDFSIGVRGAAVPEPATYAILGVGALALIRRRRSK